MRNVMTRTTSTSRAKTTEVKITAIDKYLTFHEGGKVIRKIEKGDGFFMEYDLSTNVTNLYKSYYNLNGKIKIDISWPDGVIDGDIYEFMLDFCDKNPNIKIVETSCEQQSGGDYIGNHNCLVYCGN